MQPEVFDKQSEIPASAKVVFAWHERPGAFYRLTPPWVSMKIPGKHVAIANGQISELIIKLGPFAITWKLAYQDYIPNEQFRDVMSSGPFAYWNHLHRVESIGSTKSHMIDHVEYVLPFGKLGRFFGRKWIQQFLLKMFNYRHRILTGDIADMHKYGNFKPLRILITGSSGLIGSALKPYLTAMGHQVICLVRQDSDPQFDRILWDPENNLIDVKYLEHLDAVIHLAGENLNGRRWNKKYKSKIYNSRVKGTNLLASTLKQLKHPPKVLITASAIGFYGNRHGEVVTEESLGGVGFLANLTKDWELETEQVRARGIRLVNLRFGVVLTPAGEALAKMLLPFQMGLGGTVGRGEQSLSWVAIDDVLGAIYHGISCKELDGPVNVVAPEPCTNQKLTKTLGAVLKRPTFFRIPKLILRILYGEVVNETLFVSTSAKPVKLQNTGYEFRFPKLEPALRHILGKEIPGISSNLPNKGE